VFNRGLKIDHSQQREIVSYIASQHPRRRVISTATTGWLGDAKNKQTRPSAP